MKFGMMILSFLTLVSCASTTRESRPEFVEPSRTPSQIDTTSGDIGKMGKPLLSPQKADMALFQHCGKVLNFGGGAKQLNDFLSMAITVENQGTFWVGGTNTINAMLAAFTGNRMFCFNKASNNFVDQFYVF